MTTLRLQRITSGDSIDTADLVPAWREAASACNQWYGTDPELVLSGDGWIIRVAIGRGQYLKMRVDNRDAWDTPEDAIQALWMRIEEERQASALQDLFEQEAAP